MCRAVPTPPAGEGARGAEESSVDASPPGAGTGHANTLSRVLNIRNVKVCISRDLGVAVEVEAVGSLLSIPLLIFIDKRGDSAMVAHLLRDQ